MLVKSNLRLGELEWRRTGVVITDGGVLGALGVDGSGSRGHEDR